MGRKLIFVSFPRNKCNMLESPRFFYHNWCNTYYLQNYKGNFSIYYNNYFYIKLVNKVLNLNIGLKKQIIIRSERKVVAFLE
ncbi:MAG: hypothetical protein BAJALOKI1v1_380008 [Promethearchaeota archaeon]|nr:MAG: hypothetical protein BAJALOKI1v1_380008 [Candidatus Lokiarchaeota archaeon]